MHNAKLCNMDINFIDLNLNMRSSLHIMIIWKRKWRGRIWFRKIDYLEGAYIYKINKTNLLH